MTDLPIIFATHPIEITASSIKQFSTSHKWAEFVSHLSQFSEISVSSAHETLQMLNDSEPSGSRKATLLVGVGRCQIHEGDLIKGAQTLGYASTLVADDDLDTRAMVIMEMSSFLAITGQYDLALMLLDRISNLTKSNYLLNLANYYWLVLKTRKGDYSLVSDLEKSAKYFKDIQEFATLAYHYKNIGNIYRKSNNYPAAEKYYADALELAQRMNYKHIESAIVHDIGMLKFHQNQLDEAITTLEKASTLADSYYTQGFTLLNIGYLYSESNEWQFAAGYLKRSLNIVLKHDLYFLLPSLTYLLGKSHNHLGNPAASIYYYRKGYESAMELTSHHFPCTGYRKMVIDKYVVALSENQKSDKDSNDIQGLSFAMNKTLQQIRAIFQGSIFEILNNQHGKVEKVIQELRIPRRTFFDTKKRITNLYPGIPHPYCFEYYQNNSNLNWTELNQKFDSEICAFLLEKYNFNKTTLGEKLSISYTHAIKLTEGMTKPALRNQPVKGM